MLDNRVPLWLRVSESNEEADEAGDSPPPGAAGNTRGPVADTEGVNGRSVDVAAEDGDRASTCSQANKSAVRPV